MRQTGIGFAVFALAAVALFLGPMFGAQLITPNDLLNSSHTSQNTVLLLKIRLPRVLLAFVAGSALAVSGLSLQAVFRNPLATPFTLGISNGAAFGAAGA